MSRRWFVVGIKAIKEMKKLRGINDCLSDCVGFYFNIHTWNVPFFIGYKNFGDELRRFFKKRGLKIYPVQYHKTLLKGNRYYIVQGLSPRFKRKRHAVIYKGRKPYYDPHWSQKFLKKPEHIWMVESKRDEKQKSRE